MTKPLVAIVGRPNVGKSSLLNRLAGRRVSIVEPTAGVTRDRVCVEIEWGERQFSLMDTGGLGLVDEEKLKHHIETQIRFAIDQADVVIFVVDTKDGFVPGDQMVARELRKLGKPVLLAVNKVESYSEELTVHEWARLGFGEVYPISAKEGFGISDLMAVVLKALPELNQSDVADSEEDVECLEVAIIGKRNSGKSTLTNLLCGQDRVIVSEIPGTTRDSVDVVFEDHAGRRLKAVDTAGVRKKSKLADAIELFSYTRATDSIRRADMVVHMFDIRDRISQVDKKVVRYCAVHNKPILLIGNKVDMVTGDVDIEKWDKYVRQQLAGIRYAPLSFISAKDGINIDETIDLLFELRDQSRTKISTRKLNECLHAAKRKLSPRSSGKFPKLYYATQIGTEPITILLFVNQPRVFRGQYERYLHNILREEFGIEEVPIRLIFRERQRSAPGGPADRRGSAGEHADTYSLADYDGKQLGSLDDHEFTDAGSKPDGWFDEEAFAEEFGEAEVFDGEVTYLADDDEVPDAMIPD